MILIPVLILYVWLGDKANQFCKRNILHLQTAYVTNIIGWLTHRLIWAILLGWITIPLSFIMWIFGAR